MGIRRVRLTGGEPTLRRDIVEVVADIHATPGIEEVALTTNGHRLEELAAPLRRAGLRQLNVSLDTFDGARLERLSGRAADVERIRRGIAAAAAAGYPSLKINTVVLRDVNDAELGDLARFAWRYGAIARYIELMPFGGGNPVSVAEMQALLVAQGVRLEPDATRGWGPARHMRGISTEDGREVHGLLGFIGAISENFCEDCNRVRVSAAGALRACLGGRDEVPLADLLRIGQRRRGGGGHPRRSVPQARPPPHGGGVLRDDGPDRRLRRAVAHRLARDYPFPCPRSGPEVTR